MFVYVTLFLVLISFLLVKLTVSPDSTDDMVSSFSQRRMARTLRVFHIKSSLAVTSPNTITSRLFLPARTGRRSFETMTQTMDRVDAWLRCTGSFVGGYHLLRFHAETEKAGQVLRLCIHVFGLLLTTAMLVNSIRSRCFTGCSCKFQLSLNNLLTKLLPVLNIINDLVYFGAIFFIMDYIKCYRYICYIALRSNIKLWFFQIGDIGGLPCINRESRKCELFHDNTLYNVI